MREIQIDATIENIDLVTNFVNEILEQYECPMNKQIQIDIAIDEIFGNIAHYAYPNEVGQAKVQVEVEKKPLGVTITFIDKGIPYDPTAKDDPDVSLGVDEREAGGLGIFMVKKSMDTVEYEYRDGQNILTIQKKIDV